MKKIFNIVLSVVIAGGLIGLALILVPRWLPTDEQLDDVGNAPGALPITEVTQTRHADVAGSVGCDVRLLYPQIADGSLLSSDVRDAMNDAITKQVRDFFSTSSSSLDDAATLWVTECQNDLTETIDDADGVDDPSASAEMGWVSEIGYDMKLNDGKYLSLGIANYLQTGGAHPNTTELFLTFDIATGKLLTLRDVLPTDGVLAFETSEKQWLIENEADFLFEESLDEFKAFVTTPTQLQADAYVDDAIFYLTPTEYVTFYNPYMIAPYATGPLEVRLPRS